MCFFLRRLTVAAMAGSGGWPLGVLRGQSLNSSTTALAPFVGGGFPLNQPTLSFFWGIPLLPNGYSAEHLCGKHLGGGG